MDNGEMQSKYVFALSNDEDLRNCNRNVSEVKLNKEKKNWINANIHRSTMDSTTITRPKKYYKQSTLYVNLNRSSSEYLINDESKWREEEKKQNKTVFCRYWWI